MCFLLSGFVRELRSARVAAPRAHPRAPLLARPAAVGDRLGSLCVFARRFLRGRVAPVAAFLVRARPWLPTLPCRLRIAPDASSAASRPSIVRRDFEAGRSGTRVSPTASGKPDADDSRTRRPARSCRPSILVGAHRTQRRHDLATEGVVRALPRTAVAASVAASTASRCARIASRSPSGFVRSSRLRRVQGAARVEQALDELRFASRELIERPRRCARTPGALQHLGAGFVSRVAKCCAQPLANRDELAWFGTVELVERVFERPVGHALRL